MLILSGDVDLEIAPEIMSPNNTISMFPARRGRRCELEIRAGFGLVLNCYLGGAYGTN